MSAAPWLLALSVALINLPRFVLGKLGPLQRTDVADHYVDKFVQCGAWIRSPSAHLWNPGEARGWGMLTGSVNPQHLGCVLAAALPIEDVFPLFQTIVEMLVVVGAWGFARHNLRLRARDAFYAALIAAVIYYGHNENPFVTSVALVPLLAFLTSVDGAAIVPRALRVVGCLLVVLLSFPFYALPLMPLAHAAFAACASSSPRRSLVRAAWFWAAFAVFYAPNIVAYARLAPVSNRAFFHSGFDTASVFAQLPIFLLKSLAYPALAATVVATRRGRRPVLWAIAFGVLVALQTAVLQSSAWPAIVARVPLLLAFTPRLLYYASAAMFVAVALALRERAAAPRVGRRLVAALAIAALVGGVVAVFWWPLVGLVFAVTGAWTGALVVSDPLARWRGPVAAFVVALAFVVPAAAGRSVANESWPYGNLFAAADTLPSATSPQRVVTVVNECYPHRTYAAQAVVAGAEALDGVTVFFDRGFAERWWWYVTRESPGCSREFYYWSNRIELTATDVARRPELVVPWLRVNNVAWVRSEARLDAEGLVLVDTAYVPRLLTRDTLCRAARRVGAGGACRMIWRGAGTCGACAAAPDAACASCFVPTYRYRVDASFPRAFAIPGGAGITMPATLADEERVLRTVAASPPRAVALAGYGASRVELDDALDRDALVVVSTNAAPGWHVAIDGERRDDRIGPPLFGMVTVRAEPGRHRYVVWFDDGSLRFVVLAAVLGLALLVVLPGADAETLAALAAREA